jgi:uncharacterized protein YyaL (SSP411 family)
MSKQNRLANETSPYLQQHAENPVDWFPWGPEAIEKARRENKPILLSLGYAACHWCHVMAPESFEDQATADLMNAMFVNIKVDREERPDLDKIYQTTHYLLTQRSGGWPLTTFLTADDLTPFFSGTYFPLEPRNQMPAFKDILQKIAEIYRNRQDDIKLQNKSLQDLLQRPSVANPNQPTLNDEPLKLAMPAIENHYDEKLGGFGDAPKFPHPKLLEFLLQEKSNMALTTLLRMAEGGIYDQLRGGFYRYSVDAKWEIPHFEKMLYDNAQLLSLYAEAASIFDEPYFADIARETAEWVISEMQSSEGGYFSSLDADTEGHEGKYYVWHIDEIEKIVSREEFQMLKVYYGLDEPANFDNLWHFHIVEALKTPHEKAVLASAKKKLLATRQSRVYPHRDEKILTAWNGLMIKGMFTAGDALGEPRFIDSARKALTFVRTNLWKNGRLLASYKDGKAHLQACLDDYAFLLSALLTAYRVQSEENDLAFAKELADGMIKHFYDNTAGGFFFTADDHEKLLYRPKTLMDESTPSGNGVAVASLIELGQIVSEPRYQEVAEKTLAFAWAILLQHPSEHCALLLALSTLSSRAAPSTGSSALLH